MSLGITAVASGASDPQAVQIAVTGLTPGVPFTVTGAATGWSWRVPGAVARVAPGTGAVVADFLAPLGVMVTYTLAQAGSTVTSSPVLVTVTAPCDAVLHSLDGQTVVPVNWLNAGDAREQTARVVTFPIPGRAAPVVRWDTASTDAGTLLVDVEGAASATLRALVAAGGPLVFRTNGQILDVDPVQIVILTKAPRSIVGVQGTLRQWALSYQVIDYPDLTAVLAASNWGDFDTAWAALTWTDFDTYFAGLTWADFDVLDWTTF